MSISLSFILPDLEGKANLTALDIKIKKLRDSTLQSILSSAEYLLQEGANFTESVATIDGWLDKLKQMAEEVITFSEPIKRAISLFNLGFTQLALLLFPTVIRMGSCFAVLHFIRLVFSTAPEQHA